MMKRGDLIFVYGTLRLGASNDLSRWGAGEAAKFLNEAAINGDLYDCGWFPGAVNVQDYHPEEDNYIYGDVFELQSNDVVAALDSYEGYPHLYGRTEVLTGTDQEVWVYIYGEQVQGLELVESGDWLSHSKGDI